MSTNYGPPICTQLQDTVGRTPLVILGNIGKDLDATIAVKLEYMNPTCSIKDRAANRIITQAELRRELIKGKSVLIEGTSGNTGIALAALAARKGYKCILVMPSSMSLERRALFRSFGAQLVLTDPKLGFRGVDERVQHLASIIPHAYKTNQFFTEDNVLAHYHSTGPEIWNQTDGKVDIVCFGSGTGGTITGTGKYLKEKNPNIKVYALEPAEAPVLNGKPITGKHRIQGIGADIIPPLLDRSLYEEVLMVSSDDAMAMARHLATSEGILAGISSGANVCGAIELAKRAENKGKLIVTSINSYGERYLSSELYETVIKQVEPLTFMSVEESEQRVKEYLSQ